MIGRLKNWLGAVALGLTLMLGVGALSGNLAQAAELAGAAPPKNLKPGLAASYYYNDFKDIDELNLTVEADHKPDLGEPLPNLDYRRSPGKPVLSSKFPQFVGAVITGFLNFPEAGAYSLRVTSNDGVVVTLGGAQIYEDPDVHPDRESEPLAITVTTPGWIALEIRYFQRKGSSALILAWQPPSGGEPVPVPAERFGHAEK
jgi:hypothetical protein